jgi:hypothetical protein
VGHDRRYRVLADVRRNVGKLSALPRLEAVVPAMLESASVGREMTQGSFVDDEKGSRGRGSSLDDARPSSRARARSSASSRTNASKFAIAARPKRAPHRPFRSRERLRSRQKVSSTVRTVSNGGSAANASKQRWNSDDERRCAGAAKEDRKAARDPKNTRSGPDAR